MAENYKHLYEKMKWMVEKYQDEIVPELRKLAGSRVGVVRCKACKHWYKPEQVCLKIYSDGGLHPLARQKREPDDFCSYGERRIENAAD